jgi:hypothetical protein
LVTEGEKFREWIESGSIGEVWNQVHSDWKNIFGHMSLQEKLIGIALRFEVEFQQRQAALQKHCEERVQKMIRGNLPGREPKSGGKPQEDPGDFMEPKKISRS